MRLAIFTSTYCCKLGDIFYEFYRRDFWTPIQEENLAVVPASVLVLDVSEVEAGEAVARVGSNLGPRHPAGVLLG